MKRALLQFAGEVAVILAVGFAALMLGGCSEPSAPVNSPQDVIVDVPYLDPSVATIAIRYKDKGGNIKKVCYGYRYWRGGFVISCAGASTETPLGVPVIELPWVEGSDSL